MESFFAKFAIFLSLLLEINGWLIIDLTIGNDGATHGSFVKPGMACDQRILTIGQRLKVTK